MTSRKLIWYIFPSFFSITLIAIILITFYGSITLRSFYLDQKLEELKSRAFLLEDRFLSELKKGDLKNIDFLCKDLGHKSGTRFTIILLDGKVVGDSEADPAKMENHSDRPEVIASIEGSIGAATRYSPTLDVNHLYVAIPLKSEGKIIGILRTANSIASINPILNMILIRISIGALVTGLIMAVVSYYISRRITSPFQEMKKGAEMFASGDLSYRLPSVYSVELNTLSDSLNTMAERLADLIRSFEGKNNELVSILGSMVEGVLAVDKSEKIIILNDSAAELFDIPFDRVVGKFIQEVIRNTDVQDFISEVNRSGAGLEREIVIHSEKIKYLQAHGTILKGFTGEKSGVVVVFNDITRMKKLENVRRDFVSNVSHELKTPITAITAAVETLQDGALKNKSKSAGFLEIITKNSERLDSIIDDLLSLSKIERDSENREIAFETANLRDLIESAIAQCRSRADTKKISLKYDCGKDLEFKMNVALMEQALMNLIDNAIKYSDSDKIVWIECEQSKFETVINVIDQGWGIPPEHHERLFERFYRVDKARSTSSGGTGLGLAIVKHIIEAHGGKISVSSEPGKGSIFKIVLNIS